MAHHPTDPRLGRRNQRGGLIVAAIQHRHIARLQGKMWKPFPAMGIADLRMHQGHLHQVHR
ncbi:hypothetical protein [Methylohalobius crimeensis]|uniref:hypothetical protein n=1 Tax=Methylohalobius crimeensis TaxID=244365 RepID=UPI0013765B48|nr:hypothetical protein [Methylohalobius crimeensis]